MDKISAPRITSSRSLRSATFLLAGWRLSHPTELPGDLPVPWECHTLAMNTIKLLLTDVAADISMLKCSAQFRILFIHANFGADNASHALASSATARPTFNVEEEVVVIRNGRTPKKKKILLIGKSEYIGHVCKASISGFNDRRFKPWQHLYVVSLRKTHNQHCFSRISCKMSTRRKFHRKECLFSAVSSQEEIWLRY